MSTDIIWRTEKRRVDDLKLFEGNPRKMTKGQAEQLMKSIEKFNLVEIPAIDQNNRVIAGNMRIMAMRKLGRGDELIDVRVPSRPLTEEEAREYLLRSNKNTGEWDLDLLAEFEIDLLKNIGFTTDELAKIVDVDIRYLDVNELQQQYSVVVKCQSEEEQKQVMEMLNIKKPKIKFEDFIKEFENGKD